MKNKIFKIKDFNLKYIKVNINKNETKVGKFVKRVYKIGKNIFTS